uniref:Uncharacterized protein n=1 Tax=viral metagenome TaxID=1070528 RepID=A0A6C0EAW9_9ZZZZ
MCDFLNHEWVSQLEKTFRKHTIKPIGEMKFLLNHRDFGKINL